MENGRFDEDRRRKYYRENGRASKYDSNRNYKNSKNDNYDDEIAPTNNTKKPNRHNNKNSNQYNDTENYSKTYTKYNKEKRNDSKYEYRDNNKRKDESKSTRNNNNMKSNAIKIDLMNCSQREKLTREIDSGKLECLVCCELIKPFHSVWSCSNCYHIIHLNCVIKWAASSKSDEGWRCCACQNISKTVPSEYFCFCGKAKDPQYNRNDVAHSCGETCGRVDSCVHPCTQLCHPGNFRLKTIEIHILNNIYKIYFRSVSSMSSYGNTQLQLRKNIKNISMQSKRHR